MDSSMVVPIPATASPPVSPAAAREVGRLNKRIRELAAELVAAREAASLHLARELHDGVGAELTAARFALANVETWLAADAGIQGAALAQAVAALATAQQSLNAACDASRHVVAELHAPHLDAGIVGALSQWTRKFADQTRLLTSFVCAADVRLTQLSHDAALAVFRVAQEALNNVAKHAGASRADVRIETDLRHLTLIVQDDGRGLARRAGRAPRASDAKRGFGLPGMRARCEAFGGTLQIAASAASASCKAQTSSETPAPAGTTLHARFAWQAMLEAPQTCRVASQS
jgi:two-component system, NarL family, sensor histidine kinase UhpB